MSYWPQHFKQHGHLWYICHIWCSLLIDGCMPLHYFLNVFICKCARWMSSHLLLFLHLSASSFSFLTHFSILHVFVLKTHMPSFLILVSYVLQWRRRSHLPPLIVLRETHGKDTPTLKLKPQGYRVKSLIHVNNLLKVFFFFNSLHINIWSR